MNRQEVFNKVATHLLKQGRRSISPTGYCRYRAKDGASCAIGCLIPNDLYNIQMEGRDAAQLLSTVEEARGGCYAGQHQDVVDKLRHVIGVESYDDVTFLNDLQSAHDRAFGGLDFVKDFSLRMAQVAYDWMLDSSILAA